MYFMVREEIERRLGSVADAAQLLSVVPGVEVVEGLSEALRIQSYSFGPPSQLFG